MHTYSDLTIALAHERVADHHAWAARQRLVNAARKPRRSILQSLARLGRGAARPSTAVRLEPQLTPVALALD